MMSVEDSLYETVWMHWFVAWLVYLHSELAYVWTATAVGWDMKNQMNYFIMTHMVFPSENWPFLVFGNIISRNFWTVYWEIHMYAGDTQFYYSFQTSILKDTVKFINDGSWYPY